MNWIKSNIFFICIFFCYRMIGKRTTNFLCLESMNGNTMKETITGFFIVYFIGFIVGLPCQYLHVNWNVFQYSYLFLLFIILIYSSYKEINCLKINKEKIKTVFFNHIIEYWFVYLLIILFTVLSLTNVLGYYINNYDDTYYIGKIVNQVGSNHLSIENYYNGAITHGPISITRLLNTFEICYGFFASLFHISIPFFCRCTMVLHNYFIIFTVYKLLAEYFVSRKTSQYCLIPFTVLLVSAGYTMEGNFPISINMFDGWQFQTAIFYGGSIVRTIAIPTILIYSEKLLYEFKFRNILFIAIMYITFMSFSTIFLIYAVIVSIVLFLAKGIIMLKNNIRSKRTKHTAFLCILGPSIILMGSQVIDKLPMIADERYFSALSSYIDFSNWYFYGDTFVYYALAIFTCAFFIYKSDFCEFASLVMVVLFLIVFTKQFYELIILSSGSFWFVGLRFSTSIQLLLILFIGCLLVTLIQKLCHRELILSTLSILTVLSVVGYIEKNMDEIKKQNWLASGMTEFGYSVYPIVKNDKMIPNVMCEVGDYFNSKEYGNYPLLLPPTMNWDGYPLETSGFLFSSNRIELCTSNGANNLSEEDLNTLYKFYSNEKDYDGIKKLLSKHKIQYVLVQDYNQKEQLLRNGWTIELSSDRINETYFLLKKSK